MRIPNSVILITGNNRAAAVKYQPRWFEAMYRRIWARRVDPITGIQVQPYPENAGDEGRYSEFETVAQAELATVKFFIGGTGTAGGTPGAREQEVTALFYEAFPKGLGEEIRTLLQEDAARTQAREGEGKTRRIPHASFLQAKVPADVALAFQARGWATLTELPNDLVALCEAGASADLATTLLRGLAAAPAETAPEPTPVIKSVSPFAPT